jgi:hypothetical protein
VPDAVGRADDEDLIAHLHRVGVAHPREDRLGRWTLELEQRDVRFGLGGDHLGGDRLAAQELGGDLVGGLHHVGRGDDLAVG